MPEFAVGPLFTGDPQAGDGLALIARARAAYGRLQRIEERKDAAFFQTLQETTGLDLAPLAEVAKRDKALGELIGPLPALLTDLLITSPTAAGADLPRGVDATGRPIPINQNATGESVVGADQPAPPVVMLPMWSTDP